MLSNDFVIQIAIVISVVAAFYLILIRPQIQRIRRHRTLIANLKTGDVVIIAGGLIGTISGFVAGERVEVDLGPGVRVTALRSSVESVLPQ
jgi:preprotein translocase subunit YajC